MQAVIDSVDGSSAWPNGARGLDIDDDAELHVDEIVVEEAKNAARLC
jgi:hypothetical protein